jgi:orotidine-5'-phosphate decarboxylase
MDASARAWLTPGSSLEADALTVSPYLGVGALAGSFDLAAEHAKGLFVLAATSNPEGAALQAAAAGERTVAAQVAGEVGVRNAGAHLGSFGLVVGATLDRAAFGLTDELLEGTPILAPGFGFQGARAQDLSSLFGAVAPNVVASESRSILSAGPAGIAARIAERAALYA